MADLLIFYARETSRAKHPAMERSVTLQPTRDV